MKDDKKDKK